MKRRPLLAIPAIAALALAGCGLGGQSGDSDSDTGTETGTGEGSGELSGSIQFQTWSLRDGFSDYFEGVIEDFEAEHPGTAIEWIDQPGDGYSEQLLQQVNTNSLPDVVNIPPDFAFELLAANALVDLESADPDALPTYTEGGLEAYRFDGHEGIYGYPWYLGTDLSWWNTELMAESGVDEIPTSFDEHVDAALTIAENGGPPLFSSAPGIGDLNAEGVPIMEDGEFVFNTPEGAQILQQYIDLFEAGAMPPEVLASDYAGNADRYREGAVSFTTAGTGFFGDLLDNAPSVAEVTTPTARLGTPPLFVQGISVASDSDNPELALAFAQFVTNNDNQIAFVQIAQGFLPGTAEANANPESFTTEFDNETLADVVALAAEAMPDAQVPMPVQWSDSMNTYAQQQIALALRGDITAQEALDVIVQNANDNL